MATLRLLGMPLARIRTVLGLTPGAAAQEVEAYWHQVRADTASREDIVATLVRQLRNEAPDMTTSTGTLHAELGTSHRQGARDRQQDALLATAELYAVADGFGDRDDLAAAALAAFASGGLPGAVGEVAPAVHAALPAPPSAGTTLTAVRLEGTSAHVTHVGDGRVWLVREGEVQQVTHDHTVVAGLVEAGQLTEDEVRSHEHRNLLNRALAPGVVADEVTLTCDRGIGWCSPRTACTPTSTTWPRCSRGRLAAGGGRRDRGRRGRGRGARQPHGRGRRPRLSL